LPKDAAGFGAADRAAQMYALGRRFQIAGRPVEVASVITGHIHDTYLVTYVDSGRHVRYIHQRINQYVFRDPPRLMENIERVIHHVRAKLESEEHPDISRHVPSLVYAHDGRSYCLDEEGAYWRTWLHIEGARSHAIVRSPVLARRAAAAFGRFARLLADLPGPRLHETITDFHDTPRRYEQLRRALDADAYDRATTARQEIDFAGERIAMAYTLLELQEQGGLQQRIAHNDTKITNVLFDTVSDEALCVIDLDTVMSGLLLHDFGDLVRTAGSASGEDERNLEQVHVRLPVFEALAQGYLAETAPLFTQQELSLLPFAGKLVSLETGVRFLTDYLEGDKYFKIAYPQHNLERARNQFALVSSIERQESAMQAAIFRLCR
jgi:aminoglycoside phosphotransferase (APT) family kinase protein